MNMTRIVLCGAAVAAILAMAGCDPKPSASPTSPASAAPATSSAAPAPTTSAPPAVDAATVKACTDVKKDLKDNAAKIAKAEKIGPPAGHLAVSAQWYAGATAIIAHVFEANGTVRAAADEVQKEMGSLGDATGKSASAKPSKKKLDAAVKKLTDACSAA